MGGGGGEKKRKKKRWMINLVLIITGFYSLYDIGEICQVPAFWEIQTLIITGFYSLYNIGEICQVPAFWEIQNALVVVVAFSPHVKIFGECSTIHSMPALFFLKWRLDRTH